MLVEAHDGKLYIPKDIREKHGDKFELVDRGDKIFLIPISDDPLDELREEWSDVDKSVKELKESALKEGMEEAGK